MARRYKQPLVILQHNPFVQYSFPWNIVERGADMVVGRYTLRSATKLLAISEYTRCYVQELMPGRSLEVLYDGVNTKRFTLR